MDENIVRLFLERDERAPEEAKKKYSGYCLYIARNLLRDPRDAEECVNDALMAAWSSIPPNRPENLKTYLGKLTREAAVDRLRWNTAQKRAGDELDPLDELDGIVGRSDVESEIEARELGGAISSFLRERSGTERDIFIRRYWYFDPVGEIAARFGFGKSKVKMTLKRTRDALAEYLRKEGYII